MFSHHNSTELGELLTLEATQHRRRIHRIVLIGCIINLIMMVLKLSVGYWGHSDALMADGYHSLNDFAADLIMLIFIGISFKAPDSKYSYGYGKFETFSTFLISILLLFVAWHITHEAIESIHLYIEGETLPQPDIWTVIVVLVSMASKEFLYRLYKRGSKSTGVTALLTNAWHHRSDALSSIATLIGVSFAHFLGEGWRVLDPIASLILVILIIVASIKMLVPAFRELMDVSCDKSETDRAAKIILETDGVLGVEHFKSRKNGHLHIYEITIFVNRGLNVEEAERIAASVRSNLEQSFGKYLMIGVTTLPMK